MFLRGARHGNAISVICLTQFYVSWCHDGRPHIKGAGKVKSSVNETTLLPFAFMAWENHNIGIENFQYSLHISMKGGNYDSKKNRRACQKTGDFYYIP